MTEEVKEKLFSEIGKGKEWVKPEKILVIKRDKVDYNMYWSEDKKKFGPLLEATIYNEKPKNIVENGVVVDYREIIKSK